MEASDVDLVGPDVGLGEYQCSSRFHHLAAAAQLLSLPGRRSWIDRSEVRTDCPGCTTVEAAPPAVWSAIVVTTPAWM
jgi:hypothetical protein